MPSLATNPILVVDDEQNIRLGFSVALRSAGFDVELAADGNEALERAAEIAPDCILLDLRMPGMDGLQTARALRANGYRGPLVLASAFADHATAVAAIGCGITDFLTKPVKPTELRYAVNHALSRNVRFSQAGYTGLGDIPPGLRRAYAKHCLCQLRLADAKAALHVVTAEGNDLQSLLLLGAIYELEQNASVAHEHFSRAAEIHAQSYSVAASNTLFQVFSHTENSRPD
jgi:CheY-like chemotaxis protein